MNNRNQEIYELIEKGFPGLVYFDDDRLYMVDKTISTEPLTHQTIGSIICIYGINFNITLNRRDSISIGSFVMDYDFKLSMDSCMELYKNNLSIWYLPDEYLDGKTSRYRKLIKYDREIIERQWTIKNIINEQ